MDKDDKVGIGEGIYRNTTTANDINTPAASSFDESMEDVFRDDENIETAAATLSLEQSTTTPEEVEITYRRHLKEVCNLTYPIILSEVFQNTLPVMDIAFVGQLSKDDLGAAALATVWFNLWNAAMIGFMTAIDTLLSQSYGANHLEGFQAWAGSSLIIVFFVTIIISGIVAICGPVMKLFGQDPDLADAAQEFSLRLIPGLFPYYIFKVLTKHLQTQGKLAPGVWIGVLANGMNALFNWGLIFAAGWGLKGAPWATTFTRFVECILITIYMFIKRHALKDTLPTFSRDNLSYSVLRPFWKLAISGASSIACEAWSFEITTILAGLLGTVALDAHIITLTIATFIFLSFPFAIGIAASIRVGQLIGDSKAKGAKRSSHVSLCVAIILQTVLGLILWPCADILGDLFSSDDEVSHLVSQLIPISCIFMIGDAGQAIAGGVLRGIGRQKHVLFLNILGFWLLAVPIGAVLTFVEKMGVFGLWWGFVIGIYSSGAIALVYLHRVDWKLEARRTIKRLSTIASSRRTRDINEEEVVR